MPPIGYKVVTLKDNIIEQIDSLRKEEQSRSDIIETAIKQMIKKKR